MSGHGDDSAIEETDDDTEGKKEDAKSTKEKKGDDESNKSTDGKKKKRSIWPFIILGIVVIVLAVAGLIYYLSTKDLVSTDDAYTEGRAISIAAKVSGYVTTLNITDNQRVKAADPLLQIDPRDYIAARDQARGSLVMAQAQLASAQTELDEARVRAPANLKQAQAQLDQARANQSQAQRDFRRQQNVDPRATTQQNVDQASSTFRGNSAAVTSAEAQVQINALVAQTIADAEATVRQRQGQVAQAEASLAQAELNLSYTDIRAPQDGKITMRNVERGAYVSVGQQLFYVVPPETWVVANFKENQLARMLPGQHVDMTVDAYPSLKLGGHVDSIQQGSGARFSTFPAQNATGNFVKIVRRVPVKIDIDSGFDRDLGLPLGLSVAPTVTVR